MTHPYRAELREEVGPWVNLAGGDVDFVKVRGMTFAVAPAEMQVLPQFLRKVTVDAIMVVLSD